MPDGATIPITSILMIYIYCRYVLYGGMQDWNYLNSGCLEVTIELSDTKYPNAKDLPTYWNDNKESMLSFLEQVIKSHPSN